MNVDVQADRPPGKTNSPSTVNNIPPALSAPAACRRNGTATGTPDTGTGAACPTAPPTSTTPERTKERSTRLFYELLTPSKICGVYKQDPEREETQ